VLRTSADCGRFSANWRDWSHAEHRRATLTVASCNATSSAEAERLLLRLSSQGVIVLPAGEFSGVVAPLPQEVLERATIGSRWARGTLVEVATCQGRRDQCSTRSKC
jgi:hypothetical protein